MKIIYLLTLCLFALQIHAQSAFVQTDIVLDLEEEMEEGQMNTIDLDINQDGIADLRIHSWSNQIYQASSAVELKIISDVYNFKAFYTQEGNMLRPCPTNPTHYNSNFAYLYRSDITRSNTKDFVLFPFQFTVDNNVHYAVLHVLYEGSKIKIVGFNYNATAGKTCDCQTSNQSMELSTDKPIAHINKGSFSYYNLLGQPVTHPKGVVLKVYESGKTEKLYIAD